jgi:hypothetical protein
VQVYLLISNSPPEIHLRVEIQGKEREREREPEGANFHFMTPMSFVPEKP